MSDRDLEATRILRAMAHPTRLNLLSALCEGEECVCHLTALVGKRQAYVSQQLASLRAAGLLAERKEGLRVYYRLRDPRTSRILKYLLGSGPRVKAESLLGSCRCPKCHARKGYRR